MCPFDEPMIPGMFLNTLVRAESDHMLRGTLAAVDMEVGKLIHLRQPTTPDNQPVIRMNQDRLYFGTVSSAIPFGLKSAR